MSAADLDDDLEFALPPRYHLPRLYSGVVWSDVVADIRAGVTLPSDGTAEHVIPVSTEAAW